MGDCGFIDIADLRRLVNNFVCGGGIIQLLPNMQFKACKNGYSSPFGFGCRTPRHPNQNKTVLKFGASYPVPMLIEAGNETDAKDVLNYIAEYELSILGTWTNSDIAQIADYCQRHGVNVPTVQGFGNIPNTKQTRAPEPMPAPQLPFFKYDYSPKPDANNSFCRNVLNPHFTPAQIKQAIEAYRIQSKADAVAYWYIDIDGKARQAKTMHYSTAGRRDKTKPITLHPTNAELTSANQARRPTFFGEHLLMNKKATVCIVEAEKSAIVGYLWEPKCVWLATGGKSNKGLFDSDVLQGRKVVIYPDADAFAEWQQIAQLRGFECKDFAKKYAFLLADETRQANADIADIILEEIKNRKQQPEPVQYQKADFCPKVIKTPTPEQIADTSAYIIGDLPTPELCAKIERIHKEQQNPILYDFMLTNANFATLIDEFDLKPI